MEEIKNVLVSIDSSLKSIAKSLEKLTGEQVDITETEIIQGDEIDPNHKESLLFMQLTEVYMEEERERLRSGKTKKAARRISVNLGEAVIEFLNKELSIPNLTIERSKVGGLIVFSQNEKPFAVLKFMTDLGYSRSERFFGVIDDILIQAEEEFGVERDNVFFLISSLQNGIEKSYVEQLIGERIESNTDFLFNKKQVELFVTNYINHIPYYQNPKANVYFMAAELHPNSLANDIQRDLDYEVLDYYEKIHIVNEYEWLSSIEQLVDEITRLAK